MSIDREESAAGTDGMQMDKARLKRLVGGQQLTAFFEALDAHIAAFGRGKDL